MKITILFLFSLLSFSSFANDTVHKFAASEDCQACHSKIYDEFYTSMHAISTPQKDPIHAAVWNMHPKNLKLQQYSCGKCHTPTADNINDMLTKGSKALPIASNPTHQAGISCAYCHRIESVELQSKPSNTNIISEQEKKYFGTVKGNQNSPFHEIMENGNEHMANGDVCLGCHSHKKNKYNLDVCVTDIENVADGDNCVSCHMPKVEGSVSDLYKTINHSFHGFAGSHFHSDMLTKHVDISLVRQSSNLVVNIENKSSHAFLLHPLRVAVLKVSVTRDGKTTKLADENFVRIIGHDGKPSMPWKASTTLTDTMIQAKEKRVVEYDFKVLKGDKVDIVLGWFLVNPNSLKTLQLEKNEIATEFHVFKKESFSF